MYEDGEGKRKKIVDSKEEKIAVAPYSRIASEVYSISDAQEEAFTHHHDAAQTFYLDCNHGNICSTKAFG